MTEQLYPASDCLLIFLDEVGHEEFAGNQHYFGYRGCAVMARDYEALKQQWRTIRQLFTGNPDQPVHAAEVWPTVEQFQALKTFFVGPRLLPGRGHHHEGHELPGSPAFNAARGGAA
jgi:hypothetical protein